MAFVFQLGAEPGGIALGDAAVVHVFQCENADSGCAPESPELGANRAAAWSGDAHAHPPAYPQRAIARGEASADPEALRVDLDSASFEALGAYDRAAAQVSRSKAGGVPIWTQGPAWPTCCGARMEFVAQLEAEPWGLRFGDDGVGYLFRCSAGCATPFRFLRQSA